MRMTFALLALVVATGCAHAEDEDDAVFRNGDWVVETASTLTIRADNGGNIHDYADLIATLSSTEVRIVGVCKSSCTMFLGLPKVCVSPEASFGFHGPSSKNQSISHLVGLVDKIAALQSPVIGERFRSDWGLTRDFTWLSGTEVLAMDPSLRPCDAGVTE
ncbi:MAG: hypothetical protein HC783_13300 [Rhodobacteraceae bacterium]|nr:hypothetical protein [Paracoccaceae bacterium]